MCTRCESPFFTIDTESVSCDTCEKYNYLATDVVGEANDEYEPDCKTFHGLGRCCPCPDPTRCDDHGTTIETVFIPNGYWRFSATTAQVLECDHDEACTGTNATSHNFGDGLCGPEYEGPLCR